MKYLNNEEIEEKINEINSSLNIVYKRAIKREEKRQGRRTRKGKRKEKKRKEELLYINSDKIIEKESGIHRNYDSDYKKMIKFTTNKKVRQNICDSGGYYKGFISNY